MSTAVVVIESNEQGSVRVVESTPIVVDGVTVRRFVETSGRNVAA